MDLLIMEFLNRFDEAAVIHLIWGSILFLLVIPALYISSRVSSQFVWASALLFLVDFFYTTSALDEKNCLNDLESIQKEPTCKESICILFIQVVSLSFMTISLALVMKYWPAISTLSYSEKYATLDDRLNIISDFKDPPPCYELAISSDEPPAYENSAKNPIEPDTHSSRVYFIDDRVMEI